MQLAEYEIRQDKVTLWMRNQNMDFTITMSREQAVAFAVAISNMADDLAEKADYLHNVISE